MSQRLCEYYTCWSWSRAAEVWLETAAGHLVFLVAF